MAEQRIEKAFGGTYLKEHGGLDRFRFSSDGIDRDRQVVNQQGIDTSEFGGTFFWGHDAYGGGLFGGTSDIRNVLGAVSNLEVKGFSRNDGSSGKGLEGDVQFATQINPRADMAQKFVRAGVLGKTSIGFLRQKAHKEIRDGNEVLFLDGTALLEISLVPIPSNNEAEALINSMARNLGGLQDPSSHLLPHGGSEGWEWFPKDNSWRFSRRGQMEFEIDGSAVLEMAQEMALKAPELRPTPPLDGADNGLAQSVRAAVCQWGRDERLRRAVRRAYTH